MADIRRSAEDALSNMQSLTQPVCLAIRASASALKPMQNFVDNWTPLLNKVKMFCDLMDGIAEVHPYAKIAWGIVSIPQKIMNDQMDRDDRIQKLFVTMNSFYDIVSDLENRPETRLTLQDLPQRIAQQTIECFYFIRDYAKTEGFVKRIGQQLFSTKNVMIDTYCTVFVKFKEEFYGRVAVQTLNTVNKTKIVVTYILDDVEDSAIDINLDDMSYVNDANFDEAKGC
ncbi:hypothetical protein HETIRDRAFT_454495 [Heterobasidion irregulare TC 32-1]|uniref:Uncharacterized protein n=1 Tax=Heterobasidion irregulare (strain TC 32-1) TaxID=747525 RepID=W4JU69_HETIT|nr:uncharacterized protein HETIRDRAFT_454495 [Heterobasidion irregulare TC 32-1]ETW77103.1 hypothetical protein HETIRDRAFT_454495 [Heterobasidion irregulare TC 32-1]